MLAQADSPQVSWIENSEGDFQNEYVMVNLNGTSVSPALRIIDAERDGDRDFLYASGGRVGLLLNDIETRKGGFWRFVSSSSVSSQSPEVNFAVGDHDLDGDTDFVATRNNGVVTYRNDGHANFSQSQYLKPAQDLAYREPTLGDFDGDGDLDLFVRQLPGGERDENPGDIYYFENVAGVFAPAQLVAANILRYSVDDLDGDGIPEVIAVTADMKDFDVYQFASETYRFSQQLTASFGGSPWFKVLDAEKDSDNDIVFGGPWSHLSWLENLDGKGRSFERNTISDQRGWRRIR